jgi:hypothetical protein
MGHRPAHANASFGGNFSPPWLLRRVVPHRIVRTVFGRSILLGLEFLVAADIIRTVAAQPSLQNVAVLGLIVLIRTFLSFSLEVEIDGRWPWRRAVPVRAGLSTAPPDTSEPGGL